MTDVAANLARVRERIERACRRAGRDPAGVRLVGVGKTKPPELLAEAVAAGLSDIGENYVREFLEKRERLSPSIRWHFVGRLQSNKARQVVGKVELIHSLDRESLLEEIEKRAAAAGVVVRGLLKVNLGGEAAKGGADEAVARRLLETAAAMPHLRVEGLMSIPPPQDDPEALRPWHRRLARLAETLRRETGLPLPELSMGMSSDLETAVEEGATLVRVGTDLFGPRH